MKNFFKLSRFWTFEQFGSRQEQMIRYLTQVQQEMFKWGMHRNIVGTLASFPIHYYVDPSISIVLLAGVGIVQGYSVYKYKKCTQVLGYNKDQKHLLKGDFTIPPADQAADLNQQQQFNNDSAFSINNMMKTQSSAQSNYEKYLKEQQNEKLNVSSSQEQPILDGGLGQPESVRYIQIENTEQRMKYYNRQLFCMGILQGLFLGNYYQIWEDGYIYGIQLCFFANTFLNGKLFEYLYAFNYKMTHIKTLIIGSITPFPLLMAAPIVFNNGFLQSNILNKAQMLFLSENINQDPSLFLMHRTGMRLAGLILLYLFTFATMLEDTDEDNEDENNNNNNGLRYVIEFYSDKKKGGKNLNEDKDDEN